MKIKCPLILNGNIFSGGLAYQELAAVKRTNNESSLFLISPSSTDLTDVCQIWNLTYSNDKYEQCLLSNNRPTPHMLFVFPLFFGSKKKSHRRCRRWCTQAWLHLPYDIWWFVMHLFDLLTENLAWDVKFIHGSMSPAHIHVCSMHTSCFYAYTKARSLEPASMPYTLNFCFDLYL